MLTLKKRIKGKSMNKKRRLAILALSSFLYAGVASAEDYGRSYEGAYNIGGHQIQHHSQNHGGYDQRQIRASGERLHDKAIEFMNKARNGQLSPEHRQMFNSVQYKANDLIRRLQNGQLTPQERAAFEAMQRQMRNPLTY